MKKLLSVLFLLGLASLYFTNGFVNMTSYLNGDYTFYNKNFTNTYFYFDNEVTLYSSNSVEAQLARLKQKNIKAESVKFKGGIGDVNRFIDKVKIKVVSEQTINNILIIYGYTDRLKGSVVLDDIKINVQIAIRDDIVTIGTPLIIGSY